MSMMKRYCEEVSADMGLDGEITDEVMVEAQARLDAGLTATGKQEPPGHAARRLVIVDRLVQLIEDFWEYTEPNRIYRQEQPLSGSDEAYNATQLRKYDDLMQRAQFVMDAKRKRTPATDPAADAETVAETQAAQVESDNA